MSDPADTDRAPQPERWICAGQRLTGDNGKCHDWVPEGTNRELLFRHQSRHGWAIGAIHQGHGQPQRGAGIAARGG
ncbi:MAG: hypothetical protein QOE61_2202 [Micromonosporaceae bacterium]|jgi:hypothetical protein|nr:hypothetical protein [Micromonosporaceae bacterium]